MQGQSQKLCHSLLTDGIWQLPLLQSASKQHAAVHLLASTSQHTQDMI